ncbi:hypothetical protein G7069_07425 [Lysobacter sp. HDW10]|jgi:hypothetical protein|uniref:hypothetical protein n=1 Tax=Lysobacter sp. HDW10 TaxID=2714936 RepID=UPI00140C0A9A|nr:hypothetical protein [Lysobacter sp. HDW10]QIK81437.1 hypothetical protein G7069_07425 [Lysobacter sp. HDW10]
MATTGYIVYLFPPAIEALGAPAQPLLQKGEGEGAEHFFVCKEVDTAGALVELTIEGRDAQGRGTEIELMIPMNMVRMIVSAHVEDAAFGFRVRTSEESAKQTNLNL